MYSCWWFRTEDLLHLQVRDHPVYHLIKARIQKKQGDHAEAVKTLQLAMVLPGVKKAPGNIMSSNHKWKVN